MMIGQTRDFGGRSDAAQSREDGMKIQELLKEVTPLPWRSAQMDNHKLFPSVRIFGRRKRDPSQEVRLGSIDSPRDAEYACHAANALPQVLDAANEVLLCRPTDQPTLFKRKLGKL